MGVSPAIQLAFFVVWLSMVTAMVMRWPAVACLGDRIVIESGFLLKLGVLVPSPFTCSRLCFGVGSNLAVGAAVAVVVEAGVSWSRPNMLSSVFSLGGIC
jgi:hypothetical protein